VESKQVTPQSTDRPIHALHQRRNLLPNIPLHLLSSPTGIYSHPLLRTHLFPDPSKDFSNAGLHFQFFVALFTVALALFCGLLRRDVEEEGEIRGG